MRRIQKFSRFIKEDLDMPQHENNPEVFIFDSEEFSECKQKIEELKAEGLKVWWGIIEFGVWQAYVRPGYEFAIIKLDDTKSDKSLLGALINQSGNVIMCFYNNDAEAPLELAQEHL